MTNGKPNRAGLAYYQSASLVLLLVVAGFGISGLWGLAGLVAPSLTIEAPAWRGLHSRGAYLRENFVRRGQLYYSISNSARDGAGISVDEATESWQEARAELLALERGFGLRRLVLGIIALLVCLPLYGFHHRVVALALRRREESAA